MVALNLKGSDRILTVCFPMQLSRVTNIFEKEHTTLGNVHWPVFKPVTIILSENNLIVMYSYSRAVNDD